MFKTNEYFDGNVKSIAFQTSTLPATLGVMAAGQYTFNTADKEAITVISGSMNIEYDGNVSTYQQGDSFEVAADSAFNVTVESDTAYLCLYG